MQRYYNKAICHAAVILRFRRDRDDGYLFILDDGSEYSASSKDEGFFQTHLISSPLLYDITHEEIKNPDATCKWDQTKIIERPIDEWIIPSRSTVLVERYDMQHDEMRVAVVEEEVFRANFYLDNDPVNLIEMQSVEKPNHFRS